MKISNEELIEDLKRVGILLGKVPTGTEYERYGKYSLFPYKSKKSGQSGVMIVLKTMAQALLNKR